MIVRAYIFTVRSTVYPVPLGPSR